MLSFTGYFSLSYLKTCVIIINLLLHVLNLVIISIDRILCDNHILHLASFIYTTQMQSYFMVIKMHGLNDSDLK